MEADDELPFTVMEKLVLALNTVSLSPGEMGEAE